jgi:hypothetical protein
VQCACNLLLQQSRLVEVDAACLSLAAANAPGREPRVELTDEWNSGSFYIRQQVPDGETLGKWSRMITLAGTRG